MDGDISLRMIGILGGMGPLATVEFLRRVIEKTPAKRDQEHVPMIVLNVPQIPDRTDFLLGRGEDPRPMLIDLAKKLERMGAEAIFIPCNTAHAFYREISSKVSVPVFHMPARTVYEAKRRGIRRMLLLATLGTYISEVYSSFGKRYGVEILTPEEELKEKVHSLVYKGVKAGSFDPEDVLEEIFEKYGKVTILLGCTELSVLKRDFERKFTVVDPLDISAEYLIKFSFSKISASDLLPP